MQLRPYRPEDRTACLAVFDSNVPSSFLERERPDFARHLDHMPGPFLVVESGGRIVACGGYAESTDRTALDLCWGMVARSHHHRGLGTLLLEARLRDARRHYPDRDVRMNTSQHTVGFFERHGFRTVRVTKDGYARGVDRYDLVLAGGTGR